ncbi:uncharacterized protein YbjT (DUF2867 family) [Stackebrandtia endophytica]|uniref:Uncharacterized protein YbjT (DUF2867 family) n=1 Tax=Stackebrandtia endophytica TaxID=1496996 RepID=A0A543AQD3_9ACTN|nr:NmrA/HSCARG family protein [Stackebrandtia endophytica]TQL74801.1 uncharacterized protein YbjT (DUF2867 family) [Stackebrandtia endophytica]
MSPHTPQSRQFRQSRQSSKGPILVVGATGRQGGAAARHLSADGWSVRLLVRDPRHPAVRDLVARGAEPVIGDLDRPDTLEAALAGAYGVFLIPPVVYRSLGTDVEQEYRRGHDVIEAAERAGVEHVVFSGLATAPPPGLPQSDGKHRIEQRLRTGAMTYTILRPVRFMENYLFDNAPMDGILNGVHRHLFLADKPMQIIAVDDIGRFTALAFADPAEYGGRILELAGDDPTPDQAAALIAAAVDMPVRYERISHDQAEALGPEIAATWRLITDNGDNGWRADPDELRTRLPGMLRLTDWLAGSGAQRIRDMIDHRPE